MDCWRNPEDVLRDIQLYSVVQSNRKELSPPPTVLEYQARLSNTGNPSIYDVPPIPDENITLVNTGRGRSCFSTYRPGGNRAEPDDMEVIRKKLKEVNGIGFSNELIEENYRRKAALNNKPTQRITTPVASSTDDELFVDASSESPVPTSPPRKPDVPSTDSSVTPPSKKETPPINSLSPGSESPRPPPPPLREILKLGKKKVPQFKGSTSNWKTNISSSEESSGDSDYWWNYKGVGGSSSDGSSDQWGRSPMKRQEFDISSSTDFPELR